MFQATPGKLPAAGELEGVKLPPGGPVRSANGDAIAWISDAVLPQDELEGLIDALAKVFPQTGLWPLQAKGQADSDLARPWKDSELAAPSTDIPDALDVLARAGAAYAAKYSDAEDDQPKVPPVTALAPAAPGPDPTAVQLEVDGGGLLLVPVGRPGDAPAALGWFGATDSGLTGADISAVLRSWEDRFGAVLVGIGFDTLVVQVGRLPETDAQLTALVSEHYAFCPDNIEQGVGPDDYRAGLTEWTHWNFWWD